METIYAVSLHQILASASLRNTGTGTEQTNSSEAPHGRLQLDHHLQRYGIVSELTPNYELINYIEGMDRLRSR
jgi:hypothetical protein